MGNIWSFLEKMAINPLWTLGSFVLVVILSVILFRKGQKSRGPRYYIKSHNLITDFSNRFDKLQILYGDKPVKNLTVSKIAFWNDGTETMESKHIAQTDPLRVESVGDCEIVDASVIMEKNKVNELRIEISNTKQVKIMFGLIDKEQGGAIQVIHTGKGSSDIKLDGYIEGAGKPLPSFARNRLLDIVAKVLSPSPSIKPQPAKARRMMSISSFIAAAFMLAITIATNEAPAIVFGIIASLLYAYLGYVSLKRRVPRGFEIVEEED